MTHQDIADRAQQITDEFFEGHRLLENVVAEKRLALREECEKIGHIFSKPTVSASPIKMRFCILCKARESNTT